MLYPSPAASQHPLPSGEGFARNQFHYCAAVNTGSTTTFLLIGTNTF